MTTKRHTRNVSAGGNHWLGVRLVGSRNNRDGIGAQVRVMLPDGTTLHNHATTSVGYASSSESVVHFGLGKSDLVQEIEVRWPGGSTRKVYGMKPDTIITIREGDK